MAKRLTQIIGTVLCLLLAIIAILLILTSSGKDSKAVNIIIGSFAAWMLFGVYRGLYHIISRPRRRLSPTYDGIEYNVTPVSGQTVVRNFFNPLSMKFRTVGSMFIIITLWVCMEYFSPKFAVYFWIILALTIIIKVFLLIWYLKLNTSQNTLGRIVLEQTGDIDVCRYDVTASLIDSADATPEEVIDPIRPYVNVSGSYDDYKKDVTQFSICQRHILAVNWYVSEVYGDGHYGFFTDSVGMIYLDAIEGLKAVGAKKYATILEDAVSRFDGINHPLFDLEQRVAVINESGLDFENNDDALYSLDEFGEKIAELQMAYIRSHISDFLFDNPQKH